MPVDNTLSHPYEVVCTLIDWELRQAHNTRAYNTQARTADKTGYEVGVYAP